MVGFARARDGADADVTFAWRRGDHGRCQPFGRDTSLAHTGPVVAGTFVHFDADADWSGDAGVARLDRTVAHEVGHVLGLDHSTDAEALLHPAPSASEPAFSDRAGLHSLYGGGSDGPGDLFVDRCLGDETEADALRLLALRRISPPEITDFRLFDTDGDGGDELLVWRTDADGFGVLTIYHFAPGPVLERTLGPLLGAVPFGSRTAVGHGPRGGRWILGRLADGHARLRRFGDGGWLENPAPFELAAVLEHLDEAPAPARRPGPPAGWEELVGDLDGDGRDECVGRRTGS